VSGRLYRVSCQIGPLDDRQVDALADILWELGAGEIAFRPVGDPYRVSDREALANAEQHELARELKH
jgi:hypothetical protein